MTTGDGRETQPSARALEYAHDVRWPDSRIDLARLCEQYAEEERARATERLIEARRRADLGGERVARAICQIHCGDGAGWRAFVQDARVAIAAMREPTEATLDAALVSERGAKGMIRTARFYLGRALMHLGLKVLPQGRCRQELSGLLWTWNMKVQCTLTARNAATLISERGAEE